ncbi:MAG: hypothetical protein LBJ38_02435 [Oscillospiraceae bacterium]|jgi:hypothetical protein|nr:hypothetical protein [Oscillospiraceae bacterium]
MGLLQQLPIVAPQNDAAELVDGGSVDQRVLVPFDDLLNSINVVPAASPIVAANSTGDQVPRLFEELVNNYREVAGGEKKVDQLAAREASSPEDSVSALFQLREQRFRVKVLATEVNGFMTALQSLLNLQV